MLRKIGIVIFIIRIKIVQVFKKKRPGNILIIKPDAIGDYIIFRNFLSIIANDKKYADHKITLVGNIVWRDFACEFDAGVIDNFISINHKTLGKEWIAIFDEVSKTNYDFVVTFCYSRTFVADVITFVACSKHKIALKGDYLNMSANLKYIFEKTIYNDLKKIPKTLKTEFEFNKLLTEYIVKTKVSLARPFLNLNRSMELIKLRLNSPYVVFAPGAGIWNRQTEISRLIEITSFVLEKYNICFVGSAEEIGFINEIIDGIALDKTNNAINVAGKVSLKEVPYVLNDALCVICNDSAIYHLSMALNKPTLCIAGGGHFDRFVQYANHENVRICYKKMPCFNCNWICKFDFPPKSPYPCIAQIDINNILNSFMQLEAYF
jgi:ADP-heptose:LPS heptosyltransferase